MKVLNEQAKYMEKFCNDTDHASRIAMIGPARCGKTSLAFDFAYNCALKSEVKTYPISHTPSYIYKYTYTNILVHKFIFILSVLPNLCNK